MKGFYMLHWWGGCGPIVKQTLNWDNYLWFSTPEARAIVIRTLETMYGKFGLAYACKDGPDTHTKLIMHLVFIYNGRELKYDHDFGYGYEEDNASYMYEEGNYSCDCNRSSFLDLPELDCGEIIQLKDYTFSRIP